VRAVVSIAGKTDSLQRFRDETAQRAEPVPQDGTADGRCRFRHDFEVHILGHPLDKPMCPGQRGAPAEHESELAALD
jgi:hypothetical protein